MKIHEIDLTAAPLNHMPDWSSLRMGGTFEKGLVSVILPTYNRATFLTEAISSVLEQSYRPIELLIVDDGSTDNTADVIRNTFANVPTQSGFSAYYFRQKNRGASAARNQGLLHSRGEFIQYLDSDDVLVRHKLTLQVAALADDSLDLVWSAWLVLPSDQIPDALLRLNGKPAAHNSAWKLTERINWEPWPALSRRRFVARYPLWNELVSRWDDMEYAMRILAANPKRAYSGDLSCIQREHRQGRRQDFDYDPSGVEKGFIAAREAEKARSLSIPKRPDVDEHVAALYWKLFIEALHHGSPQQASEAIRGACRLGQRTPFRAKVLLLQILLPLVGRRILFFMLRWRYWRQ